MVAMQRAEPAYVLDLLSLDGGMLALVGSKAANLGELTRAGLPVPPGFCVTTAAYRRATAPTELATICAVLAETDPADASALAAQAARAREAVMAAAVPGDVAETVAAAYAAMADRADATDGPARTDGTATPVAVRSSATAEDLPTASFAGQQDTYLNVVGPASVLDAVHRCWASLWTDRAVTYRAVNGIDHTAVELAVVVQRMVDAEVAGVLFTADPVTGRRHRAVVDASPGLGEAVVSGAVNPDRFVVDVDTGEIVERQTGDKRVEVRAVTGGGTEQVSRTTAQDSASLGDAQVRELAALGERVERHFGAPQDIEWAVDGRGVAWLTQARPITTLFPLPEAASAYPPGDTARVRVYFCFSLAQGLHRPITPMGRAVFGVVGSAVVGRIAGLPVADPAEGPRGVTSAAGRLFVDITAILRHPVGRVVFPRVLDVMEARAAVVLRGLLDDPRLGRRRGGRAGFAARFARAAVRYRVPLVVLRALADPDAMHRQVARVEDELRRRTQPLHGASAGERLDAAVRVIGAEVVPQVPKVAPAAAAGFLCLALARRLLGDDARPGDLQTVLRGLPHNVTTEMDLSLWDLAARVRGDAEAAALVRDGRVADLVRRYRNGELPAVLQHGLARFLEQYGHRAVAEIDVGIARWREDPGDLLGVLANYLRLPDDADPSRDFRRGAEAAEAMIATLEGRARRRSGRRADAVGFSLRRTRQLAGLREMPKYLIVLGLSGVRAELDAVGEDLASHGRIVDADDVFFLDLLEVREALSGADQRARVRQRREEYARELRRRHIPRVLLSDGTEPESASAATAAAGGLRGTPASAGTVTATARVVLDPAGAHLEPGEVLVAPSTDPGWTPLFLTAGGLVMEMGGANSHGAVVAREYGIPAVVGVPDATARVTTGQRVFVDGTSGVVVADARSHPSAVE
jgi:rifampicin phosphotransferase